LIDGYAGVAPVKAAIDRVMAAYGMLKKLTPSEERELRTAVTRYIRDLNIRDEPRIIVEA
jgi:hypothetical protein